MVSNMFDELIRAASNVLGAHGPAEMWMVVIAVWAAQLIWSPLWLSVFSMGPLEWVWRCVTYGRMVPIRKPAPASVAL